VGDIDWESEPGNGRVIKQALARRGLVPHPEYVTQWEVQGPHKDMNYQVFIGQVIPDSDLPSKVIAAHWWLRRKRFIVAVYPRRVYEIESKSDWWKPEPENIVPVLERSEPEQ
jgi:hypothetical protein